jgi:hypothetical protein
MQIRYKLSGEVTGLFLGMHAGSLVSTRQQQVNATFAGFEGDQHAGITHKSDGRTPHFPRGTEIRNSRQVSVVSVEDLAQIAANMELPEIRPEWLGANLLIRGVPNLTLLPPGTRLYFPGGAVLVVEAENMPCTNPGKVIQDQYRQEGIQDLFPKAAIHLRGLVACVEKPGSIQEGVEVRVETPFQVIYSPDPAAISSA